MKEQKLTSKETKGTQHIIQRSAGKSFVKPKGAQDSFTPPTQQKALPTPLQSNMETSFGQDFSSVAIHTNSQKAVQMNARAFTQGEHVHFAPGEFNPTSSKGQNLIGHEFTHVAQQRAGVVKPTKILQKGIAVNDNPTLEREADSLGSKAIKGEAVSKYRGAKATVETTMQGKTNARNLSETLTSVLSPTQKQSTVAQFTLATDITNSLQILVGPIHVQGIIDTIRAASVAERQAVLSNSTVIALIRTTLTAVDASTIMSELLVGSQDWKNPPLSDFFTYFIVNRGTGLMPSLASMNCWESIMYAAYLAGQVDSAWIYSYYARAGALPGTTTNPTPQLWAQLGYTATLPEVNASGIVSQGDLVFYTGTGASHPGHVAVYVGNDEVISLWNQPNGIRSIQRVSIHTFSGKIQFTAPPW